MNEQEMETLLRNAPQPNAPAGLRNRLYAEIDLNVGVTNNNGRADFPPRASSARRWLPVIGFAVWFITCVVVLGVQAARIAELKENNRDMEAAARAAQQKELTAVLSSENRLRVTASEAAKAEIERLRAEITELRAIVEELEKIKAQNARIRAELATRRSSAPPTPEQDFFTVQKDRAERAVCINNIKQIGLAARMWASENGDVLPADLDAMKRQLGSGADRILVCPGDRTTRYALVSPGASEMRPEVVFLRCPIHHNVGLVDGSAQMLNPNIQLIQRDGGWVIGW